ncbi:MAG: NUDIX domain-containing protein [Candidatus Shapirobacteria bacterium]|jgi:ADP-ribose pyrophosphatase YjhB (NUDIX family)
MIEHELQRTILNKIKFMVGGARYGELKLLDIENDLFNYHLQQLVKNEYLEKKDGKYWLTLKGKSLVTNIDDVTKTVFGGYKVSVYMCPVIDGKVLLYRRLKHPQYGYVGLTSGKIAFGERILETASRELLEETGLVADFEIIGNLRQIRKDGEGKVIEDGLFYVCFTDKVEGKLTEKGLEGEYFWTELDKVSAIEKIFKPSVEIIIKEVKLRLTVEVDWQTKFIYELEPAPEAY